MGPAVAAEQGRLLFTSWGPVLSALRASLQDRDPDADAALGDALDSLQSGSDWQELAGVLCRVRAGEQDRTTLTAGLDEADAAVVRLALDNLAGTVGIAPDAWCGLLVDSAE